MSSHNSDRFTLKEVGYILKESFARANKKVYIWAGIGGVLLGAIMGLGLVSGEAVRSDVNGPTVSHENCTIFDKKINYYFNGKITTVSGYSVMTSCGDFRIGYDEYQGMEIQQTYNLMTSEGNWANKPTVTLFEVSGK